MLHLFVVDFAAVIMPINDQCIFILTGFYFILCNTANSSLSLVFFKNLTCTYRWFMWPCVYIYTLWRHNCASQTRFTWHCHHPPVVKAVCVYHNNYVFVTFNELRLHVFSVNNESIKYIHSDRKCICLETWTHGHDLNLDNLISQIYPICMLYFKDVFFHSMYYMD